MKFLRRLSSRKHSTHKDNQEMVLETIHQHMLKLNALDRTVVFEEADRLLGALLRYPPSEKDRALVRVAILRGLCIGISRGNGQEGS